MKITRSRDFTAERAWGAQDIANMNGITTRLHWTDQPYRWHINDGEEVFVVLDGQWKCAIAAKVSSIANCWKWAISSMPR